MAFQQETVSADDTITVQNVRSLLDRGEIDEASANCEVLFQLSPDDWRVERLRFRIALAREQFDAADLHLAAVEAKRAPPVIQNRMMLALGRKRGSASEMVVALKALSSLEPDKPTWLKQLLRQQIIDEQADEAVKTLERLLSLAPDVDLRFQELVSLTNSLGPQRTSSMLAKCLEISPDHPAVLAVRALKSFDSGAPDAGLNDLTVLLSNSPECVLPRLLQKRMEEGLDETSDAVLRLQTLQASFPRNPSVLWSLARALDHSGEVERSRLLIADNWSWASQHEPPSWYLTDSKTSNGPAKVHRLLGLNRIEEAEQIASKPEQVALLAEAMALPETPPDEISAYNEAEDVMVFGPNRQRGVVLTFGGLRGVPGIHPEVLDRFFGALDLTQVCLSDQSRMLYFQGVRALGPDFDATIAALAELISSLPGGENIYTFANSGGTIGSICYAEALGARASLVFAPAATINPKYKDVIGDRRAGIVFRRLTRTVDLERFDLEAILARTDPRFKVSSYVNSENPVGMAHGRMLDKMERVSTNYLSSDETVPALLLAAHQIGLMTVLRVAYAINS